MTRCSGSLVALFSLSLAAATAAAQSEAPRVEQARALTNSASSAVSVVPQQLFGSLPVSTHSAEARQLVEKALDEYENVMLVESLASARKAAQKDPKFALAYAMWSFAARRDVPAAGALAKANALAASAPPEERLLVHWMTATQSRDLLPAIQSMNDLLAKFPNDKHVLYLTAEWLYFQQDYEKSRQLFEAAAKIDPNFPPAQNMLGYAYIETGDPDPAKAIAALQRYSELLPTQPNPHDSLGEVYRYAGNDQGSLEEYAAALRLSPAFYTSQLGLGDTSAMMGDYERARAEFAKAIPMAPSSRDKLHIAFQKTLISFWAGKPEQGRTELAALERKAAQQKDPYAQYEIGLGRAFLASSTDEELKTLDALQAKFSKPVTGMSANDRQTALASMLRERVRVLSSAERSAAAASAIRQLEALATATRDSIVGDCYYSAKGYALFASGDYSGAVSLLQSDTQNPLVARQIVVSYEKLGDSANATQAKTRFRYLRAPTPQWYLASAAGAASH
jgi:tetratricopeptide (TPR) repeat protein